MSNPEIIGIVTGLVSLLTILGYIVREGERRGTIATENKTRDEKIAKLERELDRAKTDAEKASKDLATTMTRHHEEEMAAINALGNQMAEMRGRRATDRERDGG